MLLAMHDRAVTAKELPVLVPVLANDSIPPGCTPMTEVAGQPKNGFAGFVGTDMDTLRYTPVTGFTGRDTLAYRVACGTDTSIAYIYIYVAEMPDNVRMEDCYISPPAQKWSIREVSSSPSDIYSCGQTPLTGDIDGDGRNEIIAIVQSSPVEIYLLNSDSSEKTHFSTTLTSASNACAVMAMGRVKWDAARDTSHIPAVEVSVTNRLLVAYDAEGDEIQREHIAHPDRQESGSRCADVYREGQDRRRRDREKGHRKMNESQ
ncbi:MAG: hypothetical protein LBB90_11180 [Tannerella sp.]|jgi:hypothetical protein|nr:hypothetical protein [Tannerella sp.]